MEEPSETFTALDHVIVAVRSLDEAARSHARLLGRAPSWRGEHPGQGTANALFRLDNTYLELLAPEGAGPVGDALRKRLEESGEGLLGLALATPDADACQRRLEAASLDPAPPRTGVGRDADSGAFREWRVVHLPVERTRGVLLFAIEHRSPPEVLPRVEPFVPPASALSALDHVVVRSGDGDASRRLYAEGLGLRLALDRSFPRFGFRGLFFRVGGATVEVTAPLAPAPGSSATRGADPAVDALFGLAWRAGDVGAAQRRLAEAGFDVSAVRAGRKPGTRVFSVREPTFGVATLVIGPDAGA